MNRLLKMLLVVAVLVVSLLLARAALAWVGQTPPPQSEAAGDCDELQAVFVVDQSGSMFGFTDEEGIHHEPTDPNGLRFFGPKKATDILGSLRYQTYHTATMRLAMIYFGNQPQTQLGWVDIAPTTADEHKQMNQDLAAYFEPLSESLGNTLFLAPIQGVSSIFTQVRPQVDGCPTRLVVILTDGRPADGSPSFDWRNHLREVADYVHQYMPAPAHRIYVIGIDESGEYWDDTKAYWDDVTGDPSRVTKAENEQAMTSKLIQIVNEVAATLRVSGAPSTFACLDEPTFAVRPYIQQLKLTLIKTDLGLHLDVRDTSGRPLVHSPPAVVVEGDDEVIETMTVANPEPGLWQILTQLPTEARVSCQVSMIAFNAVEKLVAPIAGTTAVQFKRLPIKFQIVDTAGQGLPDYGDPSYDLQMDIKLVGPSGQDQILTLGANPGREYTGEAIPLEAGRTILKVKATSHEPDGDDFVIFEKDISTFEVQPVRFILSQGPTATVEQYLEFPLQFALVVTGSQPVELDLPTTVSATVTHEDTAEAILLSPIGQKGSYEAAFRPEKAGHYRLTYEASVKSPRGDQSIGRGEATFEVFPVTRVKAVFESADSVIATDPFLRPTGVELQVQLVDDGGNPVSPSEVGAADPLSVFRLKSVTKGDEPMSDTLELVNTGQPGLFRLKRNSLGGPAEYVFTVEPATELAKGFAWEQPAAWPYTVQAQIHPLFYGMLGGSATALLLATLAVINAVRVRQHPLSGAVRIYKEVAATGSADRPHQKVVFSKTLPRRNKVKLRPRIAEVDKVGKNIKRIILTCPSEAASQAKHASVVVKFGGRKSDKNATLTPGTAMSLAPGAPGYFLEKDPEPKRSLGPQVAPTDTFV